MENDDDDGNDGDVVETSNKQNDPKFSYSNYLFIQIIYKI